MRIGGRLPDAPPPAGARWTESAAYPWAVRVLIVDNPVSFHGPYPVARILPILEGAGWEVDVLHRTPGVSTRAQVVEALERGYDLVVGAGGDGTLRDLAGALAGRGVPLGVLPGGTANIWAQELGIPGDPEQAALMLLDGVSRPMDLGRLVLPDRRFSRFMLMAGIGIDALMLALTDPRLKRTLGAGGIALGAIHALPVFRPFSARITVDGEPAWDGRALQVIFGNTRRYAKVVEVTPEAHADDGLLDATIVPAGDPGAAMRLAWSFAAHRRPRPGDAPYLRGRAFVLETDAVPPMELDGGHLDSASIRRAGPGPYRISADPGALRAWVPRSYRGELFSRD